MTNKIASSLLCFTILVSSGVYSATLDTYCNPNTIPLYFNGVPEINSGIPTPPLRVFTTWCGLTCFPMTTFSLTSPKTAQIVGKVRTWGKNTIFSTDGSTLCFTQFTEFQLTDGTIYTIDRAPGTCGAFMNKTLVPPIKFPDAEILTGGSDGNIVAGTRKYANITGTVTERFFIEFVNRSNIVYYDTILFNLIIK